MYLPRAILSAAALLTASIVQGADERYRDVLALKPLGFWPADEGEGTRLRDLGSMGNDAILFNTGWADGTPDFNAAFQFVEIPRNPSTLSREFSLGTWVFVREPRSGRRSESRGTYLLGNWGRHWRKMPGPISLRLTGKDKRTVEVVSDRKRDVLG